MSEFQPATGDYQVDRQRHVKAMLAGLPAEVAMVAAPRERVVAVQLERLRAMVAHAKANSPWHAKRLAKIDAATVTPETLGAIPPMTKHDLMSNWDEIVCDRRLTLDLANRHIDRLAKEGPAYLLDEYHVVATGGSSGHRAVVVWDFDGFRLQAGLIAARAQWLVMNGHNLGKPPYWTANLGSGSAIHIGGAMTVCFSNPTIQRFESFPATLSIREMIRRLKNADPGGSCVVINGFASILALIARAKLAGEITLSPVSVNSGGEPLMPHDAAVIREAFGPNLFNCWGASEVGGIVASNLPGRDDLILNDHIVLVEPVDREDRRVPMGAHAAKVLATNLVNKVLPLIRYEITDEMILGAPDPKDPWQGTRIERIIGRSTDLFAFPNGAVINPFVFFSVFLKFPQIEEYQVHQTSRGARAAIVVTRAVDAAEVAHKLEEGLAEAGVVAPLCSVEVVPELARNQESGKLRRFIPLAVS